MTHTVLSCREAQILLMKTGWQGENPSVLEEFSEHCLCLVLSEDVIAIVCVNEPSYCCCQVIADLGTELRTSFHTSLFCNQHPMLSQERFFCIWASTAFNT